MKHCRLCDSDLPLDAFGVNRAKPDGRQPECRECLLRRQRANYAKRRAATRDTPPDGRQVVYFISDGRAIKIGIARCPWTRLRELQVGNPACLELLGVCSTVREEVWHERFRTFHIRGEWFVDNSHIRDAIPEPPPPVPRSQNVRRSNRGIRHTASQGRLVST